MTTNDSNLTLEIYKGYALDEPPMGCRHPSRCPGEQPLWIV